MCPNCGKNTVKRIEVRDEDGQVVRVYFECTSCGWVW